MSERYLQVPVEVWQDREGRWTAEMDCGCKELRDGTCAFDRIGLGPTEDTAFADLQQKLGYEEVK